LWRVPARERAIRVYGNNHFPIEGWYLVEAAKASDGRYRMKLVRRLEADHQDAYHAECKL